MGYNLFEWRLEDPFKLQRQIINDFKNPIDINNVGIYHVHFYFELAWEPSVLWILPFKRQPTQLEFKNKTKNIPVIFPSSPIKIQGESVRAFMR